ncbi:hypothetical protein A3862_27180 [Methylobacterium sp. XJLW]|jgi:hypothetical protein|uniref:hypothetical protein n=1 Tax=Methylobacterium sp. XJLW TaxID=739141 RepID=UPI000DAB0F68|nr:hypothetical protein [Methylobacterium sp. XJLW]AWV18767.1 hypothetical protein A3862_27180 [Methylobacterium sp. XJLW]
MHDAFRRRLLGTTLPVAMDRPLTLNTSTAPTKPPPTGSEIMDTCKKLLDEVMPGGTRPRWLGGVSGMLVEVDPNMPNGWFGLRQPGEAMAYAGPLPMTSFGIFYRGGDVVRLSPSNAAQLAAKSAPSLNRSETDGGRS